MLEAHLEGEREIQVHLDKIKGQKIPRGLKNAIRDSLLVLERNIKLNLSGKVLNVRSDRLRSSVQWRIYGSGKKLGGEIGTNLIYASVHEFGRTIRFRTRRGEVKMPKRPFMHKAFKESLRRIEKIFRVELGKMVK